MDRLPLELLSFIFNDLENKDIESLRLTSRLLADASLPHLKVDGNFYFTLRSTNRLKAISNHPILSKNLRQMFFWVDLLDQDLSKYFGFCLQPDSNELLETDWINDSGSSTRNIYDTSPKYIRALEKWLAAMTAEQTLVFRSGFLNDLHDMLSKLSLESFAISCTQLEKNTSFSVYRLSDKLYCQRIPRLGPNIEVLRQILRGVPDNLKSLSISSDFSNLLEGIPSFPNLTSLRYETTSTALIDEEKFHHFIHSATKLQSLVAHFSMRQSFASLSRNTTWNDLGELSLFNLGLERIHIDAFLLRHTIKTLSLKGCQLDAIWIEWFQFLRDNIQLTRLAIGGDLISQVEDEPALWVDTDITYGDLELPISSAVEFLVCGHKIPGLDFDWSAIEWEDIEEGYMSS